MSIEYILFHADFDENFSEVFYIEDDKSLLSYFNEDEHFIKPLLENGLYEGEWESYHLIKITGL